MKKIIFTLIILSLVLVSCAKPQENKVNVVEISLSDTEVTTTDENSVRIAQDIIYYEDGHDFTYGEGSAEDAHTKEEADAHTVVHITKPGTYSVSGKLSKGQLAIDLGKDAEDDKNAVVNLILNGVDITCEVAPAIIFYNVYECSSDDEDKASANVDTSAAGANVIIAEGTENVVNGSYVARIYEPDSVELNDDGTAVEDADKLHKYDAALYSKMSMNVGGSGTLTINAENEGLDSELNLTINGGEIYINSGNDAINTNEDGVSVTTLNGGELHVRVTGETGEGDGIDSNGWLVINGGVLTSQACAFSMDGGIDSDMGIHINGGTVIASGNMLDRISESDATFAVFNLAKSLGEGTYTLKKGDKVILEKEITNSFTSLVVSSPELVEGDYTLWYNGTQLQGAKTEGGMGFGGGMRPGGFQGGQRPEGFERPDSQKGQRPEGFERPNFEGGQMPNFEGGQMPNFEGSFNMPNAAELSEIFTIKKGANYFGAITAKE